MCELFGYQSDSLIQETELLTKFLPAAAFIRTDGDYIERAADNPVCTEKLSPPGKANATAGFWKTTGPRRR